MSWSQWRHHLCATWPATPDKHSLVQVPQAAQWLQQYYSAPTEPPVLMGSGEEDDKEQAEGAPPSKQEQFKQAVKADKEAAHPKPQVTAGSAAAHCLACRTSLLHLCMSQVSVYTAGTSAKLCIAA